MVNKQLKRGTYILLIFNGITMRNKSLLLIQPKIQNYFLSTNEGMQEKHILSTFLGESIKWCNILQGQLGNVYQAS